MQVETNIPDVFEPLFADKKFKVYYGGRGAAKSWNFARALILKAIQKKTRVLCAREIQKSIKESVHHLLVDQIDLLGLIKLFKVTETSLDCINGSEFIFEGLFRNINRIRSLDAVDICWVEEADAVSEESWQILLPTIRSDLAQIWISFNTAYATDATYQRFVLTPPPDSVVKLVNWHDNPYFPMTLKKQMEYDKTILDKGTFENIWYGKPKLSGGKVWEAFDSRIHVDRSNKTPLSLIAEKGMCFCSMDPHSRYHPAIIWGAVVPKNERMRWPEDFYLVIYDEWPRYNDLNGYYADLRHKVPYFGSIADLSKIILSKDIQSDGEKEYHLPCSQRFVDTRFAKGSGGASWSNETIGMVQEFAKRENGGIVLSLPPEKMIDIQRSVLTDMMQYNKLLNLSEWNEPLLYIYPKCKNLIRSLSNHRYEEGKEKEDEKEKDFSDALKILRAGISEITYKNPNSNNEHDYAEEFEVSSSATSWMGV